MPLSFVEVVDRPLFGPRFSWPMGVRALAAEEWLQPDDARGADLALKEELRRHRPADVMAWLPGSEVAGEAVRRLVFADLERRSLPTPPPGHHPIDTAARGVQEDLCLMERRDAKWILTAGSVCFPTRWVLADKIGLSLADIHEPVPRYDTDLGATVDRFFDRMAPGAIAWRLNWSLVGEPGRRLDPASRQAPSSPPADIGAELFMRVERQTLRRLTDHEAVCFGIRIHVWSLERVVDSIDPGNAAAMLRSLPVDVAGYKNLESIREPVAAWLDARLHQG